MARILPGERLDQRKILHAGGTSNQILGNCLKRAAFGDEGVRGRLPSATHGVGTTGENLPAWHGPFGRLMLAKFLTGAFPSCKHLG